MKTDIEIAQSIELKPIVDVVEKLGISYDDLELYGKYKAKLSFDKIREVESNPVGKLILVTAINPTPAGVGLMAVTRINFPTGLLSTARILSKLSLALYFPYNSKSS